jgi:hypothetical protein
VLRGTEAPLQARKEGGQAGGTAGSGGSNQGRVRVPPPLALTRHFRTPPPRAPPPVAAARDKYYCLPTFDVQGWPAGQGPEAADFGPGPAKPLVTDFPTNVEPIMCAGQCSMTPGCEYFVQTKPAGCWLKAHPFDADSKYGRTGPDPKVDVSCFRGEETWARAGGVLDLALPQPPQTYSGGGVLTGEVAGATAVAANASALTYYCAREYGVNGTVLARSNVGPGGRFGGSRGGRDAGGAGPLLLTLRGG